MGQGHNEFACQCGHHNLLLVWPSFLIQDMVVCWSIWVSAHQKHSQVKGTSTPPCRQLHQSSVCTWCSALLSIWMLFSSPVCTGPVAVPMLLSDCSLWVSENANSFSGIFLWSWWKLDGVLLSRPLELFLVFLKELYFISYWYWKLTRYQGGERAP